MIIFLSISQIIVDETNEQHYEFRQKNVFLQLKTTFKFGAFFESSFCLYEFKKHLKLLFYNNRPNVKNGQRKLAEKQAEYNENKNAEWGLKQWFFARFLLTLTHYYKICQFDDKLYYSLSLSFSLNYAILTMNYKNKIFCFKSAFRIIRPNIIFGLFILNQ